MGKCNVATNWEEEANQWKAECHRVSGELEAAIARLTLIITNHNAECESLCDPERCGYAPYKRKCPTCPKDWIIGDSTSAGDA